MRLNADTKLLASFTVISNGAEEIARPSWRNNIMSKHRITPIDAYERETS